MKKCFFTERTLVPAVGHRYRERERSSVTAAMSPTIRLMAGPPGAAADQSGEAGREEHRHDERRQGDAGRHGEPDLLGRKLASLLVVGSVGAVVPRLAPNSLASQTRRAPGLADP